MYPVSSLRYTTQPSSSSLLSASPLPSPRWPPASTSSPSYCWSTQEFILFTFCLLSFRHLCVVTIDMKNPVKSTFVSKTSGFFHCSSLPLKLKSKNLLKVWTSVCGCNKAENTFEKRIPHFRLDTEGYGMRDFYECTELHKGRFRLSYPISIEVT